MISTGIHIHHKAGTKK